MPRKPLTPKQREFVKHYTNADNKETYLNATQSALKSYNVSNIETAGAIGTENLQKPLVIQSIQRRMHSIDDSKAIVTDTVEKLKKFLDENKITVENATAISTIADKVLRGAELSGKFNQAFVEKHINLNVNAEDYSKLFTDAMSETPQAGGGGEAEIGDKDLS